MKEHLKIELKSCISDFETTLKNNERFSNCRDTQIIMTEHKVKERACSSNNKFVFRNLSDFLSRKKSRFLNSRNLLDSLERKTTVFSGLDTLSHRSHQLCTFLWQKIRRRNTTSLFKIDVRQWICN